MTWMFDGLLQLSKRAVALQPALNPQHYRFGHFSKLQGDREEPHRHDPCFNNVPLRDDLCELSQPHVVLLIVAY